MANVAEKVRQIRLAQYGKDVRESIASGIEAINAETEDTTKLATDKVNEMTALETALNTAEEVRENQEEDRQTNTGTAIDDVKAVQAEVERKLAAGEFMGPRPDHEWNGYSIRFKMGDGSWGVWTDLRGPMGPAGSIENASASDISTTSGFNVQTVLDDITSKVIFPIFAKQDGEQIPRLPVGYDLDDLTTSGIYYGRISDNLIHVPLGVTTDFIIEVKSNDGIFGTHCLYPNYTNQEFTRIFYDTVGNFSTWTLTRGEKTLDSASRIETSIIPTITLDIIAQYNSFKVYFTDGVNTNGVAICTKSGGPTFYITGSAINPAVDTANTLGISDCVLQVNTKGLTVNLARRTLIPRAGSTIQAIAITINKITGVS